jgi:hypothetical protein
MTFRLNPELRRFPDFRLRFMTAPPVLPQAGFRMTPVAHFKLAGYSSRKLHAIRVFLLRLAQAAAEIVRSQVNNDTTGTFRFTSFYFIRER